MQPLNVRISFRFQILPASCERGLIFKNISLYTLPYSNPYLTGDRPLNLSCISLYGDPVYPHEVLGGYDKKNYADASLLFVTFAIKKHLSQMEIEKAKAWQKKFVEYVKYYDDDDLQLAYVPIDLDAKIES